MGFNAIYLNPLNYSGFSGSLYAVKEHYEYNPLFFSSSEKEIAEKELAIFIAECEKHGLLVMMDLVINHTASDSNLTTLHPNWYKKDDEGKIKSPGAWDNGEWISWGDLAEIDNENSEDKDELWKYWQVLVEYNIKLGFKGFRCDAAYLVPPELWEKIIKTAKDKNPDIVFFAETLGCPVEDTIALAKAGFDYISSSVRWWDFEGEWCLKQREETSAYAPSVSFPENHDTERAITEYGGNINRLKAYALFTALFSEGWYITSGYEWGFRKRCDVVHGKQSDMENINYDISEYITNINKLREEYPFLAYEGEIVQLENPPLVGDEKESKEGRVEDNTQSENSEDSLKSKENKKEVVKAFLKKVESKSILILINTNFEKPLTVNIGETGSIIKDYSLDTSVGDDLSEVEFYPGEIKILEINAE